MRSGASWGLNRKSSVRRTFCAREVASELINATDQKHADVAFAGLAVADLAHVLILHPRGPVPADVVGAADPEFQIEIRLLAIGTFDAETPGGAERSLGPRVHGAGF